MAGEVAILTQYLTASFGPNHPVPEARPKTLAGGEGQDDKTQSLPEGEGRSLILRACIQCHDLSFIAAQRKTAADWQRTVKEMIRLGAPLTTDEAEVVVNYLATSLGPNASTPDARK